LYGLTPYGLSADLKISFKEAKRYIEKYFAQYPAVSVWMDQVIESTKKHGYVTTHWGRRRYMPGIFERNRVLYDEARRVAINTVAQGTAAEIMKKGMIELDKAFRKNNLSSKMILQIHDELLLEVPENEKDQVEALARTVLESVVSWSIPLVVTTRAGTNWGDVTK
jgi:DNA polymerase-1